MAMAEQPYQQSDLFFPHYSPVHRKGKLKASIAALVECQGDKWPGPDEFTSKTTVNCMKEVLLDPQYGFTKAGGTSALLNTGDSESSLSPAPEFTSSYSYKDSNAGDKPTPEEDDKQQEASHLEFYIRVYTLNNQNFRPHNPIAAGTPPRKIAQDVLLGIVDQKDCSALGQWCTGLRDLLEELQQSNGAITGPDKLGYRDIDNPAYHMYFIKITDWSSLNETRMDPDLVVIPVTDRLEIFIEPVQQTL
ncbi:hypothetical protein B0H10DRAFT_1953257 [Mycena sp. CBHHK59/15]|nr:hypothetical protein B0H10DRAFT_1953257 [Mycena sp. CBHHK59/15]